jgi:hypothetical protein
MCIELSQSLGVKRSAKTKSSTTVKPTAEGALRESRQSERAVVGNTGASSGVGLLCAYIVGKDNEDSFPALPLRLLGNSPASVTTLDAPL